MPDHGSNARLIKLLYQGNKPMTILGLAMIPLFVVSVIGIFADPRIVTGAPAWLKPAKFAISIGIYLLTLAWVYRYITMWRRLARIAAWVTTIAMAVEILIIDGQAFRGTSSHFNNATPTDALLFAIMGTAIACLWLASVAIAAALFRQPFQNRILGTALRCGMLLTVLGSASGGTMVTPTSEQIADAKLHHRMPRNGGHTVGAVDGGHGLPGTGWSTEHGDLRVPHFLGLHGLQAIGLFAACLISRGVSERSGVRMVIVASLSYFALYAILLSQALLGESIALPSPATVKLLALWLLSTLLAGFAISRREEVEA